jgi:hypothetical protein
MCQYEHVTKKVQHSTVLGEIQMLVTISCYIFGEVLQYGAMNKTHPYTLEVSTKLYDRFL